ncbi:LTA synthase family protein [Pararhodobacter oceanensis]|uniref:Sulfatase N-terminal domain-containing protein n=1 Tax=Pararhodobacter oceanensis TaxID=2172121 RepID=A0A2T8HPJ2_9RHOB|nr:LTA synthase family protein [Pararhodobacter oceanensis]PVH27359.1 hypothetical protein DDE20_18095 [Pararhodobacter oceanensis]
MPIFVLALVFATVFAPTLARAIYASRVVQAISGEGLIAFFEVFRNDAPLLGLVLALLTLTAFIRNYWLACLPFLGAVIVQLALISDVFVYSQFSLRLTWKDVVKFYDYSAIYILDLNMALMIGILVILITFFALSYLSFRTIFALQIGLRRASIFMASIAIASAFGWQSKNVAYVHYRLYQNIVSYNEMIASESREYSSDFAASVAGPIQETCSTHSAVSGPVIIYMVESLSSYQSRFFGGLNDWMPRLDEIAEDNAALTDFYASGFTTEDGELSLLTGEAALYPPNTYTVGGGSSFYGHWNPRRSLPRIFNDRGYESHFLTTSDLLFSSTGDWMSAIGFMNVRGSTDPFYDGMERFQFGAATDAALVDNILNTVEDAQVTPFIFVKTVSSHHPHIHPETGERSVEAVMRYVDAQIGRLYDTLSERGFFNNGHLVIVGDHRAMLPISREEVEHFGFDRSYTQIPAILVSRQIAPSPVEITTPYSQLDLSNTLMGLFSGEVCYDAFRGMIFGDDLQPPRFILHRRGDWRNQVSVFSGDRHGIVTLDGDDTWLLGVDFDQDEREVIVNYVNTARVNASMISPEEESR